MRLLIVANVEKAGVATALEKMTPWLEKRVHVVGVVTDQTSDLKGTDAEAILVLGGDGTLLWAARRLHGRAVPLLGINYGRLGFLASFTPRQFQEHFDAFIAGRLPISTRPVLEASVLPADSKFKFSDAAAVGKHRRFVATAMNDAVITAGAPFHMIELAIGADGEGGVRIIGDGVIVSTASGSTAYNISAGGPILSPDVDAVCITPICPHSLSFRPVVIPMESVIAIAAMKVNAGTTLHCDGQEGTSLTAGERVILRKGPHPVLLVENPDAREWRTLAEKLHWATTPGAKMEKGKSN